jgi:glycosyltransferase involved in cell wall biosynthesis
MCSNPFLSEEEEREWINLYKNSRLGSKIHIIPRQNTQIEVYNIMKNMDVGIFPSKAEGWNLELLEMMACGKPVITTNCSAHTEFCNNSNSFLIDTNETEKAYDGKWFHGQGNWAQLTNSCKEQAIEYMRHCHDVKFANLQGIQTAKNFTWENTTRRILDAI